MIKPSSYISGLCYSIYRLEPWSTCSIACVYCYARWYRGPHGVPKPQPEVVKVFAKVARRLSRSRLPSPFFRLATLSEPLQDPEPELRISYTLASIALRHEIPLIINTKLPTRLLSDDWVSLLGLLRDKRLVLVQVTAPLLDHRVTRILEPRADSLEDRLEAIKLLSKHGIPVVVRVQPLIPGFEREARCVAVESVRLGARQVIAESLRLAPSEIPGVEKLIGRKLGLSESYEVQRVEGREGLLQPPRHWRLEMHAVLYSILDGLNAYYAACKDTVSTLEPPRDCCGAHIAFDWYMLRPTLHEAILYLAEEGRWPSIEELCSYARSIDERYVCSSMISEDGFLRKTLRMHEKRLERLLSSIARGGDHARLAPIPLYRRTNVDNHHNTVGVDSNRSSAEF